MIGRRTSSIWASLPRKRLLSVPTDADRQKHIHSLIYFERHTNTDRQTHKDRHTERTLHIWPVSISEGHFQSGPPSNPRKPLLSVPTHADRQKHLQSKICTHRDAHTHTLKQKEQSRFSIDETHPSFCLTDKLPAWTSFPTFYTIKHTKQVAPLKVKTIQDNIHKRSLSLPRSSLSLGERM